MPLLGLKEIVKEFTGTRALGGVSFEVDAGEIIGLIGENGAGKSTLIKILAGVHQPDSGMIRWNGRTLELRNPRAALEAGIATIHQELACFEKLTVAENLLLGEKWPRHAWGGVDWTRLNAWAAERLASSGLEVEPGVWFQHLSAAQRQEVAIVRALSQKAKLLILDEPSASLTEPEVQRLIGHLGRLKRQGVAIIYVSHRLDEILQLTDRVVVLRDGFLAAEYATSETSIERLVRDMVGRELSAAAVRPRTERGPVIFRARGLSRAPLFQNIDLTVHAGEIVGLAGLVGAGRSEFARAVYGLYPPESGSMELAGKRYVPETPVDAQRSAVAYLPEERKRQGFVIDHSVRSAISIGVLERLSRWGWIAGRQEENRVGEAIRQLRIKTRSAEQPIATLSGGNQQKALLARCLEADPRLLILDEPTRGVDVGAKAEIHGLIAKAAERGQAVLLISSDLPEVLGLSNRIVVLHRGRVSAEFSGEEATQEKILLAASGFQAEGSAGAEVMPAMSRISAG